MECYGEGICGFVGCVIDGVDVVEVGSGWVYVW